jgi:hypothetical protein
LLHRRFLNRLSPTPAHKLIADFAEAIQNHLDEQIVSSNNVAEVDGPKPQQSALPAATHQDVKVATTKLLARMLKGAIFATLDFVIEILSRMLRSCKHIDVQVALFEALSSFLVGCTNETRAML